MVAPAPGRPGQVLGHQYGLDAPRQLRQALLHTLAPFHHVANFCLQLADFGTGFVELGLGLVDGVARVVVRLAQQL